ncbi:unnamed protein product [Dicrocoelium dendriticum]|nr:unnamed protein product [Dicrocoelium dendriticum]
MAYFNNMLVLMTLLASLEFANASRLMECHRNCRPLLWDMFDLCSGGTYNEKCEVASLKYENCLRACYDVMTPVESHNTD